MDRRLQVTQFANEIDRLVDRFRSEYDLTYAEAVGVLTMKTHLLCAESAERGDEVADE
jgi:hypothetical protein